MPVSSRPLPRFADGVAVTTRLVRATAVQFTGANADQLHQLYADGAGELGLVEVEVIMGHTHVRVFDYRSRQWRTAPVGAWIVADGTGVLVLDDPWFQALFGDESEVLMAGAGQAAQISGGLLRMAGQLKQHAADLDALVLAGTGEADSTGQESLYGDSSHWTPPPAHTDPWGPQALREVPGPHPVHGDTGGVPEVGDWWTDRFAKFWCVTLAANDPDDALCMDEEHNPMSWGRVKSEVGPLTLVERRGVQIPAPRAA